MSLELIENQIREFLKTETPEILAIKGAWGVGKTFLWNKNLLKAKDHGIALDKYSYVSLFGINSLEELKLTMFMQVGYRKHIGVHLNPSQMQTVLGRTLKNQFRVRVWHREKLQNRGLFPYRN